VPLFGTENATELAQKPSALLPPVQVDPVVVLLAPAISAQAGAATATASAITKAALAVRPMLDLVMVVPSCIRGQRCGS
jgi:hypothetical protein